MLRPGTPDLANLMYEKPGTDWKIYRKILLDPVQVWKAGDAAAKTIEKEDAEYLARTLWSKLDEELRKDYAMTDQPGPGVLRISAAITEAEKSVPLLDLVTTVDLSGRLLSEGKRWTTGTESFVGKVSIEGKATDTVSGELLAAAVDRRGGGKYVTKGFQSWNDVEEAFAFWAKNVRWRLCVSRRGTGCEKPEP